VVPRQPRDAAVALDELPCRGCARRDWRAGERWVTRRRAESGSSRSNTAGSRCRPARSRAGASGCIEAERESSQAMPRSPAARRRPRPCRPVRADRAASSARRSPSGPRSGRCNFPCRQSWSAAAAAPARHRHRPRRRTAPRIRPGLGDQRDPVALGLHARARSACAPCQRSRLAQLGKGIRASVAARIVEIEAALSARGIVQRLAERGEIGETARQTVFVRRRDQGLGVCSAPSVSVSAHG
jgi:hypothetical protein